MLVPDFDNDIDDLLDELFEDDEFHKPEAYWGETEIITTSKDCTECEYNSQCMYDGKCIFDE